MHSANCYVVLLYIRADMQIWTVSLALKKLRIIEFCKFSFYSSHVWMWELDHKKKADLKLNIQKTKIMASSPITSWQIVGETMEKVKDFIFLGSKITADGDCSHEIKRSLLLGRKVMTNLDSILKSRDITLPTKVCLVKAMVS